GLGIEAKASPCPPERRISQPVAGERRTAAVMPRPWVVHAGDGRLATTRRPFRFMGAILLQMKAMTILVLHGDPAVREELVSVLRRGGYTTLAADSAGSVAVQLDGEVDAV